ncbi:MAG: protein rep, partial [Clostridia bacterium]|nr:protein rep [Clostridia bacterium]
VTYSVKAERCLDCSKIWTLDHYVRHSVKQIKSIVRCHDAFCYVCQTLKAQARYQIYSPILREFEKDYDVYHTVLTVPNVSGGRLNWTLDKMSDRFGVLIDYLNGHKQIKGLNFAQYGYAGAVRSLEITSGKGKGFHPHYHSMIILEKSAPNMEKLYKNSFSYGKNKDGKKVVLEFSKFEILLQRIWCLLIMGIEVTKENIQRIYEKTNGLYKDGFDCKSDNAGGEYHEIFKYAIKGTYKNEKIFSYEEFKCLENALKNRRVYETYGVLRKYNFNEADEEVAMRLKDEATLEFELLLKDLQRREKPLIVESCLEEIIEDLNRNEKRKRPITYIGPASLRRAFAGGTPEARAEIIRALRERIFGKEN